MKRVISITAIIIILLDCFAAADEVLKVAVNSELAPFQTEENGRAAGIDIDIINAISKKMNLKNEFIIMPWARCLANMQDGTVDFMGYLSKNDERSLFMEYLNPPYQGDLKMFVVRKGEKSKLKKYKDLYKLRVGLLRGSANFKPFDKDTKINKFEVNTDEQGYRMLFAGRLDAVIGDGIEIPIRLKKLGLQDKLEISNYTVELGKNGYFAISKKSPFLKRKAEFEKVLKQMVKSGEVDEIIKNGIKKYDQ